MAELQARSKLGLGNAEGGGTSAGTERGSKRPSDDVEGMRFEVVWETQKGALGAVVAPEDVKVEDGELAVVSVFSFLSEL